MFISDVEIITESLLKNIKKSFSDGQGCGKGEPTLLVAQQIVEDPVLYKGHKMDFRVYFFINSAKTLQTTFYSGFGRVCPLKFDTSSFKSEVHISNLRNTFDIMNRTNISSIEGEPSKDFVIKTFEEVQSYLAATYKIDFMNATENIKDSIMNILKHSALSDAKADSQFQLFAADYLLTTDGSAKLLEINAFPEFVDNAQKKTRIYREVFKDVGRRVRNKLLQTKAVLRRMIEAEKFNESLAIAEVAKLDL